MAFRTPGDPRPAAGRPLVLPRWPRYIIPAVGIIIAVIILVAVVAGIWTDFLWFTSIGYGSVFGVTYGTKWLLFGVAAVFMVVVVGANGVLAYRLRPDRPPAASQQGLEVYRQAIDSHRRLVLGALLAIIGLVSGLGAAGDWRTWLAFANRTSFGVTDPQFHLDISFFVFDYPFLRMLLSYLFAAVLLSLLLAAVVHYLYGGLRPQVRGSRATPGARAQLFVLAGLFVLLKAVAYWIDRYGIDFSQRGIVTTGASYTDVHAMLPAKTVLAIIAVLCALLFFAGAARRSSMLPAIGFGLLVLSAVIIGGVYPAIIQQFVVKPNEQAKEAPYISREITGTRAAYGTGDPAVTGYSDKPDEPLGQVSQQAAALPDVRLLDPGVISQSFQQLQQLKSFYRFDNVLAMDRYPVPGKSQPQDMVVGVRDISGPPAGQGNWVNEHLVYTHGFGFVAALAGSTQPSGQPTFTEDDNPPSGVLGRFEPRVYFGQDETNYVIVGGKQKEFDFPAGSGGQQNSTYHGSGGVPIGSFGDRLLYAIKFRQLNILLSGAISSRSRIMYIRDPLARVAKVAPFLTLDGDPYPVITRGQVYWVVDGYTTSDNYPYSARLGLQSATADTYFPGGSAAPGTGESGQVNYIRNSVKAVVNAYTGAVTLYRWDNHDPILDTWMKAFPGIIKPRADIPPGLLSHLRYPEVLFELQRQILTQYHVLGAQAFFNGQNFWSVPHDPTAGQAGLNQPPYYLTMTMPGSATPEFSLVTSFTQRGRANMAAYMAVNSNPDSSGYGHIQILQLPQDTAIFGPQLAYNFFESDPAASAELTLLRKGGSKVTLGNLVTLPLAGGLLYTEPVYVSSSTASSAGSYPLLKRVFAYYNGQVGYAATLQAALNQVFAAQGVSTPAPGQGTGTGTGTVSAAALRDIEQAQHDYALAQAALRSGNFAAYGRFLSLEQAALASARQAAAGSPGRKAAASSSPSARPSPSASG
ncbi:MAG: UPF0182 family protein [Streptosporangiaceae bacterium]